MSCWNVLVVKISVVLLQTRQVRTSVMHIYSISQPCARVCVETIPICLPGIAQDAVNSRGHNTQKHLSFCYFLMIQKCQHSDNHVYSPLIPWYIPDVGKDLPGRFLSCPVLVVALPQLAAIALVPPSLPPLVYIYLRFFIFSLCFKVISLLSAHDA